MNYSPMVQAFLGPEKYLTIANTLKATETRSRTKYQFLKNPMINYYQNADDGSRKLGDLAHLCFAAIHCDLELVRARKPKSQKLLGQAP